MFTLDEDQKKKIRVWLDEQDAAVRRNQGLKDDEPPYYGAAGGEVTYIFTPTSIGVIARVKHSGTHKEIDVTPYDHW